MRMNKIVIKVVSFCLIFCVLFVNIQNIFQAKWGSDYYKIKEFYNDTYQSDVVFIGSSNMYCSVNPLLLFQKYGLDSYCLSSASQDFSLNLLYIKEAIKEKQPKVIVLDVLGVRNLFLPEERHRRGIDAIPFSVEKLNNIIYKKQINELYYPNEIYDSITSYIFPLLRYHTRWIEITEDDFNFEYHPNFRGYYPRYETVVANFSNYFDDAIIEAQYDELYQLFYKIVSVCKSNNVALLLVKTPSPLWKNDYSILISEWAAKEEINFIDYHELMDELNISKDRDFSDSTSHLNDVGATKLSLHLGEYITNNYELLDHRGEVGYEDWDEDWLYYQQHRAAYFLSKETDWSSYVDRLQNDNYTIYITVRDNIGSSRHPELVAETERLGLTKELQKASMQGYQAIINDGHVIYEKLSEEALVYNTKLDSHRVELISKDYTRGNDGSIKIDEKDYFVNRCGMGFVVYDNVLDKVVDSVTFDLLNGGKAYR